MKKTTILTYLIHLLILFLFNLWYYLYTNFPHNVSAWSAYGFIHFGYFMIMIIPLLVPKNKNISTFYFSMYTISISYCVIELITGSFIIFLDPINYKTPLCIQIAIMAIYLIILFANMIADHHTIKSTKNHNRYIKESCILLKPLINQVTDPIMHKNLGRLYDLIKYSPERSSSSALEVELLIVRKIKNLRISIENRNDSDTSRLITETTQLVEKRNHSLYFND